MTYALLYPHRGHRGAIRIHTQPLPEIRYLKQVLMPRSPSQLDVRLFRLLTSNIKDQAMNRLYSLVLAIILLVGGVSVATAQNFNKGLEAYNAGDYQTALQEWRPLAEQGHAGVQHNLALMYTSGEGVPQDYAEAVKWWRRAAEQGHASAQGSLGVMYEFGRGTLKDNVMAHMWFNIASANGHSVSGKWRDETAGLMTQADISKAQEMARECMSSSYQSCGY